MADDTAVPGASAAASTEATNARMLNQTLGKLIESSGSSSADLVTALDAIASAITASLIGGTTGATANRVLVSKGTAGRALQPTLVTLDPAAAGFAAAAIAFTATQRVLGRNTAGAGTGEEVTLTQLLDWAGGVAQGDVLYRAASAWDNLAAGTAGQYLQTQGAGANPLWASAGTSLTIRVYTANDTWSKPAGLQYVIAHVNGGGADATSGTGGTTSFGAHLQATGGAANSGTPGVGSGGDINLTGQRGSGNSTDVVGYGGASPGPFGAVTTVSLGANAVGQSYGGGGVASGGAAGSGAGYSMKRIAAASLAATETVTVGAAGGSGADAGGAGVVVVFEYTTT
mgnify:CR=1 FL=1